MAKRLLIVPCIRAQCCLGSASTTPFFLTPFPFFLILFFIYLSFCFFFFSKIEINFHVAQAGLIFPV